MDRRGLRAFLACSKVKDDVNAVIQFFAREALQCVLVKAHFTATLLKNEPIVFFGKQFADHASQWRDRRRAHLSATPLFAVLAEFDGYGVEGGSDSLFERLVFFAGGHGLATREGDDDQRLGDVGQLLVVEIFHETDPCMDQILISLLEVAHAGFDLTVPTGTVTC